MIEKTEHRITAQKEAVLKSFQGQTMTDAQTDVAMNLANVIDRHIHKTGSFREPLTDYAHAFARSEKFDAMKGETIIRDVYAAQFGRTMNATREALIEREKNLPESTPELALTSARQTLEAISTGETEPFYRAYDREGSALARSLSITENAAKTLMSESYRAVEGRELYDTGKELEEKYHRPRIDELRASRSNSRSKKIARV
ncbi:hypothetical protein [Jannaschia sp. 2305UL9-9]|uniref:hypothetical protein n=1 Tax=Jannaschia sp. 2305UL9-9 TaxID=3121638 RepID=UPI003528B313